MTAFVNSQINPEALISPSGEKTLSASGAFASFIPAVSISDSNYTITGINHCQIILTSLTGARTITLPSASTAGQIIIVSDSSGLCSATYTITILPNGTNTINDGSSIVLSSSYIQIILISDGSGEWIVIGNSITVSEMIGTTSKSTFNNLTATSYDCNGACSWTCMTTCTGSCNNSCSTGCSNGCTTTCQTSCSTTCMGNCTTACSYTCTGSCINGCNSGCAGANI